MEKISGTILTGAQSGLQICGKNGLLITKVLGLTLFTNEKLNRKVMSMRVVPYTVHELGYRDSFMVNSTEGWCIVRFRYPPRLSIKFCIFLYSVMDSNLKELHQGV